MISAFCKCDFIIFFSLFLVSVSSCEHGLKPPEEKSPQVSGISGKISYVNWPSEENLFDLRLVVFDKYPPENIFDELSAGRAYVYPAIGEESLPFYVNSTIFVMDQIGRAQV